MGQKFQLKRIYWLAMIALLLCGLLFHTIHGIYLFKNEILSLNSAEVADLIKAPLSRDEWPDHIRASINGKMEALSIRYTRDDETQALVDKLFSKYRPDFGAAAVIDVKTGRVLALSTFGRENQDLGNLSIRARFPAASLIKIVTAAAAIEESGFLPQTKIPYNGRSHTLYKKNIIDDQVNRWTRLVTLQNAFAKSINVVFGKLGFYRLGKETMEEYAGRFGFNHAISTDIPLEQSRLWIPPENSWALVETASGFTSRTTLSPVHGAMLAAAISNDGTLVEPYLVDDLRDTKGNRIYDPLPRPQRRVLKGETASKMHELMEATVVGGTSRKAFRSFVKKFDLSKLKVGGKTGSLDGVDPKGRYDWFAGYLDDGQSTNIAVSFMTVHQEYWRVKSAALAREFFELYLKSAAQSNPR